MMVGLEVKIILTQFVWITGRRSQSHRGRDEVNRIVFSRRREDESILGADEAVWIVTRIDDKWRPQFRHGAVELR